MKNDQDWQLSFATATIGNTPFKDLSHIVIRYMVGSVLDSIALSLNATDGPENVIGESNDHGAFRCVLKKGILPDNYDKKTNAYTSVYRAYELSKIGWGRSISMCKNRWIRLKISGINKYCYAQWEDAGPYYYNDVDHVLGSSRPANTTDTPYSGLDLSPSFCLYFGAQLEDWRTPSFEVDWNFVDETDVPDGPWKKYITTRQIEW